MAKGPCLGQPSQASPWCQKGGRESCRQLVTLHRARRHHHQPGAHHDGGCWPLGSSSHPPQWGPKQASVTEGSSKHDWSCREWLHFWRWQWGSLKPQATGEESKPEETQEEKEP